MSLILDALNRSHEQKDEVPTLGTRHAYAADSPAKNFWLVTVVVALVVAVIVIAWLLWDKGQISNEPALVQQAAPVIERTQVKRAAAEPKSEPVQALVPDIDDSAVAANKNAAGRTEVTPSRPALETNKAVSALYKEEAAIEPGQLEVSQPPDAVVEAKAPEQPATGQVKTDSAAPAVVEQSVDIESLLQSAENELENARLEEHSAPFVNGLSQQTKDSIPSIFYERHDYSGRPGQSQVVLNGKELKIGGSPASGVKVEEILPDSVVLNYRGTRFRLRALNSWVNL